MKLKSAAALAATLLPALIALPLAVTPAGAATGTATKCAAPSKGYQPDPATLTLSASQTDVKKGGTIVFFGNLSETNCVVVGADIQLIKNGKKYGKDQITDADGDFSVNFKAKSKGGKTFHAFHPGGTVAGDTTSRYITVTVS